MTYQVLARKWRPKRFSELIGQEHVVRALENALASGRLHHAYLFTGTRGVGKTTVARVFAKCLNCETGVTAEPCGQCSACKELDEGRFVDLIEVDAASRARVDETRDLMDNVQYTPARGRFKVYLIDEVHMFSAHSFNALLKTLEEPPPHVKFLLATTDPQKLPVTVLSRCLQFHMRQLPPGEIVTHLEALAAAEGLRAEAGGLALIARAAAGSMRDALSLMDQAIAHGAGDIAAEDVRAMLGVTRQDAVYDLLDSIAAGNAAAVLQTMDSLASEAVDFADLLGETLAALQRVAVYQLVPERDADAPDSDRVAALASSLGPEDVQLFYQIGVMGRRDLPFALDPRGGVEMTLLRMLAFEPGRTHDAAGGPGGPGGPGGGDGGSGRAGPVAGGGSGVAASPRNRPAAAAGGVNASAPAEDAPLAEAPAEQPPPARPAVPAIVRPAAVEPPANASMSEPAPADDQRSPAPAGAPTAHAQNMEAAEGAVQEALPARLAASDWRSAVVQLGLSGLARELALNAELVTDDGDRVALRIAPAHAQLRVGRAEKSIREALQTHRGPGLTLTMDVGEIASETPAQAIAREANTAHAVATAMIREDPTVQAICDMFDATVDPDEIQAR